MELHPRAAVTAAIAVVTIAATAAAAAGCGGSPNAAPSAPLTPAASAPSATAPPTSASTPPRAAATPSPAASNGNAAGAGGGSSGGSQSPGRCHTSMLSAHVVPGQPGAGQHYAELVLTNTSGSTCHLYGYPGMQLLSAPGGHIPTAVDRQPGSEQLVTLAPGKQASSLLHWTIVPGTGEGSPCEPSASGLIVTPPDETTQLHTSWPGGPVCQHGQFFVTAFQPGANASAA